MAVVRIASFMGAAQALHPKLLPEAVGVISLNQKVGRGDLRPLCAPANVATVPAGRQSIYRMGRDVASDANYWLSWATWVSVVRGFNTAENGERTYYTGDGFPKWTDTAKALGGAPPVAWRALGVPAPAAAPTLAAAGGSGTAAENRAYVYTYVSDADEESAPSPAATITCKPNDTITISALAAAPAGSYGINRIRIYRTETTSAGAEFFFLREISSAATSTTDDNRALGEVLPSLTWVTAPGVPQGGALNITEPTLHSLTPLWNGMLAGISGREIRFCVPFIPHAWPIQYGITPSDVTPVTLAAFGEALVVLTNGRPIMVTGGSPDAMNEQPVKFVQACVSVRSAVSLGHGVAWASPEGLAYIGTAGPPRLLTAKTMTGDDWQALKPETIISAFFEGRYYGFYQPSAGVKRSFMIDPGNPDGIYFSDLGADAVYVDELQGALYILNGTAVQRWEAGAGLSATFRSKVFQQQRELPDFSWGKVIADDYPVTFKLFTNGVERTVVTVASEDPFRIPTGDRVRSVQLHIETTVPVQGAVIAHSLEELAG